MKNLKTILSILKTAFIISFLSSCFLFSAVLAFEGTLDQLDEVIRNEHPKSTEVLNKFLYLFVPFFVYFTLLGFVDDPCKKHETKEDLS